jgi:cell fate (sporulation/competence/biofilm development) regulator YlbF (YheA/YmcA/DUF963 family)
MNEEVVDIIEYKKNQLIVVAIKFKLAWLLLNRAILYDMPKKTLEGFLWVDSYIGISKAPKIVAEGVIWVCVNIGSFLIGLATIFGLVIIVYPGGFLIRLTIGFLKWINENIKIPDLGIYTVLGTIGQFFYHIPGKICEYVRISIDQMIKLKNWLKKGFVIVDNFIYVRLPEIASEGIEYFKKLNQQTIELISSGFELIRNKEFEKSVYNALESMSKDMESMVLYFTNNQAIQQFLNNVEKDINAIAKNLNQAVVDYFKSPAFKRQIDILRKIRDGSVYFLKKGQTITYYAIYGLGKSVIVPVKLLGKTSIASVRGAIWVGNNVILPVGSSVGRYFYSKIKHAGLFIKNQITKRKIYRCIARSNRILRRSVGKLTKELLWDSWQTAPDVMTHQEAYQEALNMIKLKSKWHEYYYNNFNPDRPFTQVFSNAFRIMSQGEVRTPFDKAVAKMQEGYRMGILEYVMNNKGVIITQVNENYKDPDLTVITIDGQDMKNELSDTPLNKPLSIIRIQKEVQKGVNGFFNEDAMEYYFITIRDGVLQKQKIGHFLSEKIIVTILLKKKGLPEHAYINELNNAANLFKISGAIIPDIGSSEKDSEQYSKGFDYGKVVSKIDTKLFNIANEKGELPVLKLKSNRLDLPQEVLLVRKDCPRYDSDSTDKNMVIINDANRCHFYSTWLQ